MSPLHLDRVRKLFQDMLEPRRRDVEGRPHAAVDPVLSQRLQAIASLTAGEERLAPQVVDSLLLETSRNLSVESPGDAAHAPADSDASAESGAPAGAEAPDAADAPAALQFSPLQMLGRYCIVGKIGEGGMGIVWRAIDTSLDREVAIKFLPGQWLRDPDRLRAFRHEARLLASLNHPHIVTIHAVEEIDGLLFLVLEMLHGVSLRQHILADGMPMSQLLETAIPIADALSAAHDRGITHHDIKPENVMVTDDGWTKVLDFGLAARWDASPTSGSRNRVGDDASERIAGTIPYMAPESLRGRPGGPRSDVFALGVLLVELLTGKRPFQGETSLEIVQAILNQPTPSFAPKDEQLPAEFVALVSLCLEKDAARRPASARPVLEELLALRRERERGALRRLTGIRRRGSAHGQPSTTRPIPTLAVMPFQDLSAEADLGYLCVGVAEEIATALSRHEKVRVTPVSRIDRDTIQPAEMARLLGVESFLDGSVARIGDRIRVTARLGDVSDGALLWSERFDRPLQSAFDVQEDVANAVAGALQVRLQSTESASSPQNPAAVAAYMKGRFFWSQRYEGGLRRALECFRDALRHDADLAVAHAGVADCLLVLGHYGVVEPTAAYAQSRDAAQRALAIDPHNAEAHASMAWITGVFDWNWRESDDWFARSLQLDARYATAWEWKGIALMSRGRKEEAVAALRQAQRLDPLSLMISSVLAYGLHVVGEDEEAGSILTNVLEMEPRFVFAHSVLSKMLASRGEFEQATRLAERGVAHSGRDGLPLGVLGYIRGRAGEVAEAEAILSELASRAAEGYVSPFHCALVRLGLGRNDEALEDLARSIQARDSFFCTMHFDPAFDVLRLMPRFHVLLENMNLFPGPDDDTVPL